MSTSTAPREARHTGGAPIERAGEPDALSWASPEAKLWVATRAGEFAGFMEFRDGHYTVTDGLGRERGSAATLREAKAVLDPVAPGVTGWGAYVLRAAAIAAAGVASAALAAALGVIHL